MNQTLRLPPQIYRCLERYRFVRMESIRPGMSGARIYRCCDESGNEYALKRWPTKTTAVRIQGIHRVMQAARHSGCDLVPKLIDWPVGASATSFLGDGQFYWDLTQWMPGQPISTDASIAEIQTGAGAIARFHLATGGLETEQKIAPCVMNRCKILTSIDDPLLVSIQSPSSVGLQPMLAESISNAAGLLNFRWNQVCTKLFRSLSPYLEQPMITQFVLRDVHSEHVLFQSGRPSGLIDFDAVRIDSPATDFARWAGSFIVPDRETEPIWTAILAGAIAENPLLDNTLDAPMWRLAQSLAKANPWISLFQWLRWLLVEQRSFPVGPETIAGRINQLVESAAKDIE